MKIGVSSNTAVPCFQVIRAKGYTISAKIYFCEDILEDGVHEFIAENNGRMFVSSNLEELLGLIEMWETRGKGGEDWQANHDEHIEYQKIIDEARVFNKDGDEVNEDLL